jgi:hypothetical protein
VHLVEDQHGAASGGALRLEAGRLPLLFNPDRAAQGGLVGAGIASGQAGGFNDLLHQGGLAHLARPDPRLQKAAGFVQSAGKDFPLGADEGYW